MTSIKNRVFCAIFIGIIGLSIGGCAVNPVTGKRQFNVISEEEEIAVGKQADPYIVREYGYYKDAEVQNYVNSIGQKLAKVCGRPNISYYFKVLDSPIINAFALPGGYIYVTRGIMTQMNSEAELAFVIGHEISHVAAKHGAQRMSQARGLNIISIGATLIFNEQDLSQWGEWINLGINLAVLGYGRENEFEADLIGVDNALAAEYSPAKSSDFLKTLKRQEKFEPDFMTTLLSSHPPTSERIDRVDSKISRLKADNAIPKTAVITNRRGFMEYIQGMTLDENTTRGGIKKDTYFNKAYGFELTFPSQWKVGLEDPDHLLLFENETKSIVGTIKAKWHTTPPSHSKMSNALAANLKNQNFIKKTLEISGQAASRFAYQSRKSDSIIHNRKYVLTKDQFSYEVSFEVIGQSSSKIDHQIDSIMNSFQFTNAAPRLRIHQAKSGDSFKSIAKQYLGDTYKADHIAAFNGFKPTDSPGTAWIKIPQK